MPEPILTNLQGSAFCVHQGCIPVRQRTKANTRHALLDGDVFKQAFEVVLHDVIADPWSSVPSPKDKCFQIPPPRE